MPKQNQANEVQQDKKNRAKVQPPALSPDLTAEKAGLSPLPDSLLAAGANSIEAQAARLGDSRLQMAQRQGVAGQIGRTQGNQHLHQVVASLKAHEAAASAAMSSKSAAGSNGGAALKKSAAGTRPTVARQAEATESLGDDRFDEFLGGSGSPSLAPPPPPPDKNGQKTAVQRDGPSRPPAPNFTLTTPSLLQPPDPASRYRLGGDQTLHLDPEIQAMLHQHVQQQLAPANLRDALSQIQLGSLPIAASGAATTPAQTPTGATGSTPAVPAGSGTDTPRAATPGDLMGAVLAVPEIDAAINHLQSQALDQVNRDWRSLGVGGQVAVVSSLAVIGLGALGGAMSDPTTRQLLVDQLNGRTVPVPGLNWMRLEVNTSADNLMLGMHVDVGQLLPASWGFGPSSPSAIGGPPTSQPFVPGQRTAADEIGETDPSEDMGARIQAKAGGGKPLDEAIQRRLEDGLGADMSNVRVHTDREADELAQSVNAVAFTTGQDIFFREGTYNPNSTDGLKLLAHEATHTVQQDAGPVAGTPTAGGVSVSDPGDRFEQAAEQAANSIIQREVDPAEPIETVPTDPVATTEPVVQRFLPLVPILVGAGVVGGIVEAIRRESRSLNEPEINYAKDVFHDSLDYSVITITRGSLMSTGAPRTIGNTIHFTDDYYVGDTMELTEAGRLTLVHEMAHVWQYQHTGWTYAPKALWAQAKAWWHTGSRNAAYDWRSLHNAGTPWADWNPEAQAEAVEDYNEALRKGMGGTATPEDYETLSMLQPYIADMQAGPPPAPEGAEEGEANPNDGGGGAEGGPGYYPPAQRQIDPAPANGLVGVVQRAVIQRAFDVANASETEKIKQISEELSHLGTGTAGAGGARLITDIWNSFGDDIARVAGANIALWEATLKRIDLSTLPAVTRIKAKFKSDVETVALDYLAQNRAYVLAEMDRMGAYGIEQAEKPTLDQDEQVKEMQAIAAEVARAKQGQQKLQSLQVGWELEETGDVHKPFATEKTPVYFSPGSPPMYRTGPGGATTPASYEECQKEYDSAQLAIDAVASVYPTIFAMVQSGEVTKVEADPGAARQQMGKALQGLQQKIDAAVPKIGSGVDFDDLVPIHGALFGGQMPGASGIRWNEPFYKWVGASMVGDADTAKLVSALGVGALSAAMFVFASLATGGVATVLFVAAGTAASAGQAALDWKKWNDLSTAAEATVKPELALVTQGQVDMALFTAVVDTLFAFLDLKGGAAILMAPEKVAARQALKAAKAGTRAAIIEGLKDATIPAIERGVAELGAAETIARSGRTAEDLITIVGQGSETAKRLEPFTKAAEKGTKAALEDVAKKLPRLAEELKGGLPIAEADKLVSLAIDQYGPAGAIRKAGGWKNLSDALGEGTAAGKQLTVWRDAIRRDTFEYIEKELGGSATRTGTEGGFKNDMDISMLGKDAGKNREPARRFMAARAGCSPDELRVLLHGDVFIDPTRMLLHATESGLTPAMRATLAREAREYQEGLMNGRRLYLARQHGDDALVKALEEEMASRGVTPIEWKPLSESEISKLAADIDTEMALLEKATEEGEKARLIRSIAQKEATIKASEEGAYATSGGIWRWVFERPGDKGKFGKKALVEMWPDERYTAILAELPSLDHSAAALKYPKDAGELAGALRDLGKHGGRLTEVLGEAAVPKVAGFEEMAEWCVRIKKEVDAGLVSEALTVAGEAERFAREAAEKLAQLESASNRGLQLLRERHSFGAMSVDPGAIQAMVSAHVKYLTVRDAIERQLLALRELAQTAAREATANAPDSAADKTPTP